LTYHKERRIFFWYGLLMGNIANDFFWRINPGK